MSARTLLILAALIGAAAFLIYLGSRPKPLAATEHTGLPLHAGESNVHNSTVQLEDPPDRAIGGLEHTGAVDSGSREKSTVEAGVVHYSDKYAGLSVEDLRAARESVSKAIQDLAKMVAEERFASGLYETRPFVPGEMISSEGPDAISSRTRSVDGVRVVDIARWSPSAYPELCSLQAEMTWLHWKIGSFSEPGQQEPPNQEPPR